MRGYRLSVRGFSDEHCGLGAPSHARRGAAAHQRSAPRRGEALEVTPSPVLTVAGPGFIMAAGS